MAQEVKCPECGKLVSSSVALSAHRQNAHGQVLPEGRGTPALIQWLMGAHKRVYGIMAIVASPILIFGTVRNSIPAILTGLSILSLGLLVYGLGWMFRWLREDITEDD
jgi:hypothetical protein